RRDDVARALASLRAAGVERAGVEIVVVEETARPQPIPGVRYVPLPPDGRGFAHVRNRAVEAAKGSLLVFVDDDCEVERGWLDALLAPMADPAVAGTAGAVLVRDCNAVGYAENILGFPGGGLRYLAAAGGRVVPTSFLPSRRPRAACWSSWTTTARWSAAGSTRCWPRWPIPPWPAPPAPCSCATATPWGTPRTSSAFPAAACAISPPPAAAWCRRRFCRRATASTAAPPSSVSAGFPRSPRSAARTACWPSAWARPGRAATRRAPSSITSHRRGC